MVLESEPRRAALREPLDAGRSGEDHAEERRDERADHEWHF